MKTTVIYLTNDNRLGFRQNIWNWQLGDNIFTPGGAPCQIIKIVDSTDANLAILNKLVTTVQRYQKGAPITKKVMIAGILPMRMVIGDRRWKSDTAKLEFIENVLTEIAA